MLSSLQDYPIDHFNELALFQFLDFFFTLELFPAEVEKVAKEYPKFF
jgi:hypothetical protein